MRIGIIFAAAGLLTTAAYAQDITRVMPNGLTIMRDPGVGITVSRETPRRSFSFSIGRGNDPTATASATAIRDEPCICVCTDQHDGENERQWSVY